MKACNRPNCFLDYGDICHDECDYFKRKSNEKGVKKSVNKEAGTSLDLAKRKNDPDENRLKKRYMSKEGEKLESKTLYIAGPVTGIFDLNRTEFYAVASILRDAGYEVIIPHEHVPETASHNEAMAICKPLIETVCGLALLDQWWDSIGTLVEMQKAYALGKPFKPWEEWL